MIPACRQKIQKQLGEVPAETRQVEQELQQRKDDFSTISTPHPIISRIATAILDGEKVYRHRPAGNGNPQYGPIHHRNRLQKIRRHGSMCRICRQSLKEGRWIR